MAMSTTRYCPSCELGGRPCYTTWKDYGKGVYMCEHSHFEDHYTYFAGGYAFFLSDEPDFCGRSCGTARAKDSGVHCCSLIRSHRTLWGLLLHGMRREVNKGIFLSDMWDSTFPKRVSEIVERHHAAATAALANKLPAVLVRVVYEHLM